jgi:alpha-amylase
LVPLSWTVPAANGAPETRSTSVDEPGVTASLWEWNWKSIGRECAVLAKDGYTGVQVAPPQNSLKRTELGNGSDTLHPWWEVYQPVSYDLTSPMGNEDQFKAMVRKCRKAGVKVYVDAVINHMTGQGHTSYGGVDYTPYHYEDYGPNDFHVKVGECPSSDGGIQDFNNKLQVFKCNLVGLEDLRTETDKVQEQLAAYLNKLIGYGVSGFRVDAAKHIGQDDLDAIYARLNKTKDGVKPRTGPSRSSEEAPAFSRRRPSPGQATCSGSTQQNRFRQHSRVTPMRILGASPRLRCSVRDRA